MNFLKTSKYLSVGKWEICDYISVCQRMKSGNISVWKRPPFFFLKSFLYSLLVQFGQYRHICFSTFPWPISPQKSVWSDIWGWQVFLFTFWHSVAVPAYVNKVLGIRATGLAPTPSAICSVVCLPPPDLPVQLRRVNEVNQCLVLPLSTLIALSLGSATPSPPHPQAKPPCRRRRLRQGALLRSERVQCCSSPHHERPLLGWVQRAL